MSAHNFGIILDRQVRSDIMAKSFLEGGNKELYDSVGAVALHTKKQLSELFQNGITEYFNYISDPDKQSTEVRKNTAAAFQMLLQINILLDPYAYDPSSFRDLLKKEALTGIINSKQAEQMSHLYEIDIIAKAFAEEISFLYFLNLRNNYRFQVVPMEYYDQKQHYRNDMKLSLTPIQYFLKILRHDKQIKELFSTWIQDLGKYQEEILRTIYDFQKLII